MGKDLKGKELGTGICQIKDGRYVGRYTDVYGKRHSIYGKKAKEVKDKLAKEIYEDKMGIGKINTSSDIIFDELYQIWFKHKLITVKPSTCFSYKKVYSANIKDNIGFMKITSIKKENIENLIIKLAEENNLSYNFANLIKTIIVNIFNFAIENNMIIFNPCDKIKIPKVILKEKNERQILSIEQQKKFIKFAEEKKYRYLNVCKLMLYTGMRINETLALTWDDIDFKNRKLSVNKTLVYTGNLTSDKKYSVQKPKTKTSKRDIPLCDAALNLLISLKKEKSEISLIFFNKNKESIKDQYILKSLKKLISQLNEEEKKIAEYEKKEYIPFPNITPHSFRHTFATRCFESGINPKIVQKYLGHSSLSMTMDLYTHVEEKLLSENILKINDFF